MNNRFFLDYILSSLSLFWMELAELSNKLRHKRSSIDTPDVISLTAHSHSLIEKDITICMFFFLGIVRIFFLSVPSLFVFVVVVVVVIFFSLSFSSPCCRWNDCPAVPHQRLLRSLRDTSGITTLGISFFSTHSPSSLSCLFAFYMLSLFPLRTNRRSKKKTKTKEDFSANYACRLIGYSAC